MVGTGSGDRVIRNVVAVAGSDNGAALVVGRVVPAQGLPPRVGVSYTNYNAVIGVLYCCGFELVRRVTRLGYQWKAYEAQLILNKIASRLYHDHTVPYEDKKIEENGDVFPKEMLKEGNG